MAFTKTSFRPWSVGLGSQAGESWNYNTSDASATVQASGYFNSIAKEIQKGDLIYIVASDGEQLLNFTSANGVTPVTTGNFIGQIELQDGSVTNAKVATGAAIDFDKLAALTSANILVGSATNVPTSVAMSGDVAIDNAGATTIQAGAIDKAMLSTGINPSHITVFAAEYTTTGGGVAEAITVTGALATDIAFVQLKAVGGAATSVSYAAVTADTLTVTFGADPSNDHVIYYQIMRAAV